jgi:hypothetical protein
VNPASGATVTSSGVGSSIRPTLGIVDYALRSPA